MQLFNIGIKIGLKLTIMKRNNETKKKCS